mmetsp:Transcript_50974/g.75635  ORF Transcript_50974/g.75635 Transcript_50974/m.75635 type:complete len:203 (+) Transcript_50974:138-746(+)|eukprot:CAMPEP_0195512474 /NCGR_PEP_ID=MMETSP0794_2-20130614/4416_1 /TAXON_ID=515487 /ORGANISM="Stephanopyxis turris, Strain CCMP 815" /LENGTH=202 /DNA_ID=CAMNT_0040640263 /DNA_START=130 /DNA_END=738 /DNA_ORIENTATION=-
MLNFLRFVLIALVVHYVTADIVESRTGMKFPEKHKKSALSRLGVRSKGPIKVYAVAEYSDGTYMLKMSMGVAAPKMVKALSDALGPRCSDTEAIQKFEDLLMTGLPNGATKGSTLVFAAGRGKLTLLVDDKKIGAVHSKILPEAFASIYSDKNAVCAMHHVAGSTAETADGFLSTPYFAVIQGGVLGLLLGYGVSKTLRAAV